MPAQQTPTALEVPCGLNFNLPGTPHGPASDIVYVSLDAIRHDFVSSALAPLSQTLDSIEDTRTWEPGWNGYDALPPHSESISRARSWIRQLYEEFRASRYAWIPPYVTASEEGEVVFEWWRREKKLTIYVSGEGAEFVKVWGPNVDSDMADGEAESTESYRELWRWLSS